MPAAAEAKLDANEEGIFKCNADGGTRKELVSNFPKMMLVSDVQMGGTKQRLREVSRQRGGASVQVCGIEGNVQWGVNAV